MTGNPGTPVIVCERSGRWAGTLRRQAYDRPIRVVETRSLAECLAALADCPAALVGVEAHSANIERAGRWMADLAWRYPRARLIGFLDRAVAAYEPLLREAGALACLQRELDASGVVALVNRYLSRSAFGTLTESELIVEQRILAGLPWGDEE